MLDVLTELSLTLPVFAAPMAGGPSTPELVVATALAGGIGFVPGGYRAPHEFALQLAALRATGSTFGVNLFAPNPMPADPAEFRAYAALLHAEGESFGLDLRSSPIVDDDDAWHDKVAVLLADPVAAVSFTFGIPDRDVIRGLRAAGMLVIQTVTTVDEAREAEASGVDVLVVQCAAAGGHSGTLHPERAASTLSLADLVSQVTGTVRLPVIGAGGLSSPAAVASALAAGAVAVSVGTALLLADEAGTSATYRAALVDPARTETVVTRAFTGRPARALANDFTRRYTPSAPLAYPALHHLTRPLRQAATANGDPERVNLWAGTGWQSARARPVEEILTQLAGGAG